MASPQTTGSSVAAKLDSNPLAGTLPGDTTLEPGNSTPRARLIRLGGNAASTAMVSPNGD